MKQEQNLKWAHIFRFTPRGKSDPSPLVSNFHDNFTDLIGLASIYKNERALWSKSKTWNELTFSHLPLGGKSDPPPPGIKLPWQLYRSNWSFVSIYRNERALWSKSKTWNELTFSDLPQGGKTDGPSLPPFKTASPLSELFAVQCHQWEPIQNSQVIRKYKEISVHKENI